MYQGILTGAVLLICSYTDIRYRKIPGSAVAGYLILAAAGHAVQSQMPFLEWLSGLLPGAVCLLISAGSGQALGYGDGFLIMGCGISLGLGACVSLLAISFAAARLWGLFLLCRRAADRRSELPFVPFLFIGFVLQIL